MEDFFATTTDDELVAAGQLHAYLIPEPTSRREIFKYRDAFVDLDYLAPQPEEALHLTVARFKQADDASLRELLPELANNSHIRALPVLSGRWHDPICANRSAIMHCDIPRWDELIAATNACAHEVLGSDAVCYPAPFASHLTLAYGIGQGADDCVVSAMSECRRTRNITLPTQEVFSCLAWCMVRQHRDQGIYTFEVLTTTPFTQ
ncbi:hypothetical protein [Trueperella sp. LYQ141]|uniref:hypothetical protein n=1 Tax=Trueperella sp. LYQ141 TaxID=3391058 RepID=UPI003983067F